MRSLGWGTPGLAPTHLLVDFKAGLVVQVGGHSQQRAHVRHLQIQVNGAQAGTSMERVALPAVLFTALLHTALNSVAAVPGPTEPPLPA